MAKIFHKNSNYLLAQEVRFKRASKHSLWAALSLIMVGIIICFFVINSELLFGFKILFFLIIATVFYFYIFIFLFDHSQYGLRSYKYRFGFNGEARTFRELVKLSDDYSVYCDAQVDKYGNLDFVVLKEDLFFNIEVKNHSGNITFDGTQLLRNGYVFSDGDPLTQVLRNSFKLQEAVKKNFNHSPAIISIVVFSNPQCWVNVPFPLEKDVYVLSLRGLLKLIASF